MHSGHKILLTMAAWLSRDKLIVGLTDDELLKNKKFKDQLEDLRTRTSKVLEFLSNLKKDLDYQLVPINDVFGPTGTDPNIQALVVSYESKAGSEMIKTERERKNLPPLDTFIIDVVGENGNVEGEEIVTAKLSSTAIRERLARLSIQSQ